MAPNVVVAQPSSAKRVTGSAVPRLCRSKFAKCSIWFPEIKSSFLYIFSILFCIPSVTGCDLPAATAEKAETKSRISLAKTGQETLLSQYHGG